MNYEGRIADGWLNLTIRSDSAVITTTQFQFAGPQQPGPIPSSARELFTRSRGDAEENRLSPRPRVSA